ncbi:MAG: hypothetical protein ACLVLA_10110 [Acidaminococcus intestini]
MSSKELVDFLFEQPYCKIRFLVSRNMAKARTASKYSCQLHERGFLDVPSIGCKKGYQPTIVGYPDSIM